MKAYEHYFGQNITQYPRLILIDREIEGLPSFPIEERQEISVNDLKKIINGDKKIWMEFYDVAPMSYRVVKYLLGIEGNYTSDYLPFLEKDFTIVKYGLKNIGQRCYRYKMEFRLYGNATLS